MRARSHHTLPALLVLLGCAEQGHGGGCAEQGHGGGCAEQGHGVSSTSGGTCEETLGEGPAEPVSVIVMNGMAESIFIDNTCWAGTVDGVDGISVDGQAVFERWPAYLCANAVRGVCNDQGPDCFGEPPLEIPGGGSYQATWDGRLLEDAPVPVPASCGLECPQYASPSDTCWRSFAASPGKHTLRVSYGTAAGDSLTAAVEFTLPGSTATITVTGPASPYDILATDHGANDIAVGAEDIFWARAGAIAKAPKVGGPETVLADDPSPWAIAIDATTVYWVTSAGDPDKGKVMSIPQSGGTPTVIATDQSSVDSIAIDATNVYWTARGLFKAPLGGGPTVKLATAEFAYDLAVDVTSVYWQDGSALNKTPITGGVTTVLAAGNQLEFRSGVAVDATDVYVSTNIGIGRVPKDGGSMTILTKGKRFGTALALDDGHVYWAPDASNVTKFSKVGGGETVVAEGNFHPTTLAVDATHVYWSNFYDSHGVDDGPSYDGTIMRTPK